MKKIIAVNKLNQAEKKNINPFYQIGQTPPSNPESPRIEPPKGRRFEISTNSNLGKLPAPRQRLFNPTKIDAQRKLDQATKEAKKLAQAAEEANLAQAESQISQPADATLIYQAPTASPTTTPVTIPEPKHIPEPDIAASAASEHPKNPAQEIAPEVQAEEKPKLDLFHLAGKALAEINPEIKKGLFWDTTTKKLRNRQMKIVFQILKEVFGEKNVKISKKHKITIADTSTDNSKTNAKPISKLIEQLKNPEKGPRRHNLRKLQPLSDLPRELKDLLKSLAPEATETKEEYEQTEYNFTSPPAQLVRTNSGTYGFEPVEPSSSASTPSSTQSKREIYLQYLKEDLGVKKPLNHKLPQGNTNSKNPGTPPPGFKATGEPLRRPKPGTREAKEQHKHALDMYTKDSNLFHDDATGNTTPREPQPFFKKQPGGHHHPMYLPEPQQTSEEQKTQGKYDDDLDFNAVNKPRTQSFPETSLAVNTEKPTTLGTKTTEPTSLPKSRNPFAPPTKSNKSVLPTTPSSNKAGNKEATLGFPKENTASTEETTTTAVPSERYPTTLTPQEIQSKKKLLEESLKNTTEQLFKAIPKTKATEAELVNDSAKKDRYKNVVPYITNHVTLKDYTYVNGSKSNQFGNLQVYFTQGPLEATVQDHQTLILEENVGVVVKLTKDIEMMNGSPANKSAPYYNPVADKTKGIFTTKDISEIDGEGNKKVKIEAGTDKHPVTLYDVTSWPDHGVPRDKEDKMDTTGMIALAKKIRLVHPEQPILIHCSAGIGRTGTFAAILHALMQLEKGGLPLMPEVMVIALREDRPGMVQTFDQYQFIHQAYIDILNEHLPEEK